MRRIPIYLASTSPARHRLLTESGFAPIVVAPTTDEGAVLEQEAVRLGRPATPEEAVSVLATHKGQHAGVLDPGLVIAADTVLALDGEVFGKPSTPASALELLQRLRGNEASFVTGQWVAYQRAGLPTATRLRVATTHLRLSPDITDAELRAYVDTGEPQKYAGGLTTNFRSSPFIEAVHGDSTAMLGLSMFALRHSLAELQVSLTDVWD